MQKIIIDFCLFLTLKEFECPFFVSIDIWNQFVGNFLAELIPVFSILIRTTSIVPVDSVKKENGHINDVEVRKDVFKTASHTHSERYHEITDIIKMSREAPKATG